MDELLRKIDDVESYHWWWAGRREILKSLLVGESQFPKRILDIGCGTGGTLRFLISLLPKTDFFGVDPSNFAVKTSRREGGGRIIKASAAKLPFKKEYFDYVLLLDVLEHITNDTGALKEARRVLKKNGKIIITCPATPFIWSRHDTRQGHKRRYSRKMLVDLFKRVNLKISFINYFNLFLFLPISLIRLASRMPFLDWVANYDNPINYKVAKSTLINELLKRIFLAEIKLMFKCKYPFGVSALAVVEKELG